MKTLLDGRRVADDSAEWRMECLARHVLALRTLAERRAWLADFEQRHGAAETAHLRDAMQQVHAARQQTREA